MEGIKKGVCQDALGNTLIEGDFSTFPPRGILGRADFLILELAQRLYGKGAALSKFENEGIADAIARKLERETARSGAARSGAAQ